MHLNNGTAKRTRKKLTSKEKQVAMVYSERSFDLTFVPLTYPTFGNELFTLENSTIIVNIAVMHKLMRPNNLIGFWKNENQPTNTIITLGK